MSDKALHAIRSALLSNGWTNPYDCDYEPTAEAVLAALTAAGIAVMELPEPTGRWAEGPEWLQGNRPGDRSGWVTWSATGGRVMLQRVEPGELTPEGARTLAAALLAAADVAETVR